MSDERLKPCPFCGGEATFIGNTRTIKCKCCGGAFVCTNPLIAALEVAAAWNTRKPIERIVERLEEQVNYNAEQAEIWRSGENVDAYMIEKSNDYLDRANCYGKAIRIVKGGGVDE